MRVFGLARAAVAEAATARSGGRATGRVPVLPPQQATTHSDPAAGATLAVPIGCRRGRLTGRVLPPVTPATSSASTVPGTTTFSVTEIPLGVGSAPPPLAPA